LHLEPCQHARFPQIRRDNVRQRQQLARERVYRILAQQPIAALGDHHGVDDQFLDAPASRARRHHLNNLRAEEHPRLGSVRTNVAHDGVDLLPDELWVDGVDALHAERILSGDGGNRAAAVHAQRGEGLQIGLNTCTAA
jgi:hypothetical protein